jgi:predicted Zn-dependent protease
MSGLLLAPFSGALASTTEADALIEGRHRKRARAKLEPLAAREPSNVRALYLLSRVQAAFGDVDKAPAVAERATTLDPRNADYRFQVAEVYGRLS